MKLSRPDLAAYALAALGMLCLTALIMAGRVVPEYFPLIVMTVVGAGGGIALNTPQGTETITTRSPAPAPAPAARVPAQRPAPAPSVPLAGPAVTTSGSLG